MGGALRTLRGGRWEWGPLPGDGDGPGRSARPQDGQGPMERSAPAWSTGLLALWGEYARALEAPDARVVQEMHVLVPGKEMRGEQRLRMKTSARTVSRQRSRDALTGWGTSSDTAA